MDDKPVEQDSSVRNGGQKNDPDTDKQQQTDKKVGWIENLAQRSTGLPNADNVPKNQPQSDRSPWSLAGIGIQTAGTIALFALMGVAVDKKLGWTPWGTVALSGIGIVGSCYLLIKEVMNNESTPAKNKKPDGKK